MKTNLSIKVLSAGAILTASLLMGAPLDGVEAAKVTTTQTQKQVQYKSLQQLKDIAADYFNTSEFQPEELVVYSNKDYYDELVMYTFTSRDMSEKVQGSTNFGKTHQVNMQEVKKGVYQYTFYVFNDREYEDQVKWEKNLDKAEKFIVENYSLKTDYDVVAAIQDFVGEQITYGELTGPNHKYMLQYDLAVTCDGYTDFSSELYKRFGIESRIVRGGSYWSGNAHSWNAVKVGGKWYHADSTAYDTGNAKSMNEIVMTQTKVSTALNTNFKATTVPFEMSMAKSYDYKAVKKSQAAKKK